MRPNTINASNLDIKALDYASRQPRKQDRELYDFAKEVFHRQTVGEPKTFHYLWPQVSLWNNPEVLKQQAGHFTAAYETPWEPE